MTKVICWWPLTYILLPNTLNGFKHGVKDSLLKKLEKMQDIFCLLMQYKYATSISNYYLIFGNVSLSDNPWTTSFLLIGNVLGII